MMTETRWPTYGSDGEQIGWDIAITDVLSHGVLSVVPSDCPWFREDGLPHVCIVGLGETFCEAMVSLGSATVTCVRGILPSL